ncbi:MAG: Na+/H+ antiporter NhaC family protein [Phycisphaerae bacterium]|nr:Na+/H+ antiporter NhaC family protein [Phycisphaerae bacterium]
MFRYIALMVVALLVVIGAWLGRPDPQFLARQWVSSRLAQPLAELAAKDSAEAAVRVAIQADGDDAAVEALAREVVRLPAPLEWAEPGTPGEQADHTLHLAMESSPHSATLRYAVDGQTPTVRRVAWYAILPPLLAIMTAIIFRHVILCLVLGIVAGGVLVIWPTDQLAVWGVWHAFYYYFLRHAILDAFRIEIISFVLLICAIVGLAQHSGGINSVINWLMRFCRTARAARITTALIGLMVFFDDYMNCIIVGNALRPLTDRYRVSRAKLAYIVDSTAAPVAGLALVSTWIAFELSQITEGLVAARISAEPFEVFIRTIPYRFYCWFTLILVFVIASMGRDYGPMLAAERRALTDAPPDDAPSEEGRPSGPNGRAMYAILPIGLTLVAIVVGLWWTAQPGPGESPIVADGLLDYLQQTLGRANSARAFSRASAFGYLFALALVLGGKAMTFRQAMRASFVSIRAILGAIVILLLAWSIGAACRDVGTADYLVAMFHSVLNPVGFSLIIFGLSCLVAFATGSSYSTMAILLPNVVPLALAVGEGSALGGMALIVMSIGAVLEGAIFGDHCSPISDTTILSSISSRCDLIEHVRTQMPYGLTGMIIAVVVGYTPVALGAPPVLCLASGAAVLILVVRVLGQRTVPSDSSAA